MNEFLLHIRIFDQRKMHHVWIRDVVLVRTFLEDISLSWDLPQTEFDHFFYHLENHRVLDPELSFGDNAVISGDHFILV